MTLFRGRLEVTKGRLKGSEAGKVEFMFNPTQYSISKTNSWNREPYKGGNVPHWEFGGGEPRAMEIELFFDSYLPREGVATDDVRKLTNRLFTFMMIDTSLKDANSQMGSPPPCVLIWGQDTRHQFNCYILSCAVTYTMFDTESGMPIRATARLSLKEVTDPEHLQPTNPTSRGEPGRRLYTVQEGDRLDLIAYREYGDPGAWRHIAVTNRLFDPLDLRPGMVLAIPPL
jgi:hypothetical protein